VQKIAEALLSIHWWFWCNGKFVHNLFRYA